MTVPPASAGRVTLEDGSVIVGHEVDPWQHIRAGQEPHVLGACEDCSRILAARDARLTALRLQLDARGM